MNIRIKILNSSAITLPKPRQAEIKYDGKEIGQMLTEDCYINSLNHINLYSVFCHLIS